MSRRSSGFTLMELLIVVAIIAVLAGVGLNYYGDYIEDARIAAVRTNLKIVRDAISRYFKDHMAYPTSLESLQGPYLQQPTTAMLLDPLAGNGVLQVEVSTNFFAQPPVAIDWLLYSAHDGRQIRNVKIVYNGTLMGW